MENDEFQKLVSLGPLISIDLILTNSDHEYLLGRRKSEPAKDHWFVPGGRIRKNEKIEDAFRRICRDELGEEIEIESANLLGVFEHFYDCSSLSETIGTHYVVLAYSLNRDLSINSIPNYQHEEILWFTEKMLSNEKNIHDYAREYCHIIKRRQNSPG